jgi:hypothetical protein
VIIDAPGLANMRDQLQRARELLQHIEAEITTILREVPSDAQVELAASWCSQFAALIADATAAADGVRSALDEGAGH